MLSIPVNLTSERAFQGIVGKTDVPPSSYLGDTANLVGKPGYPTGPGNKQYTEPNRLLLISPSKVVPFIAGNPKF